MRKIAALVALFAFAPIAAPAAPVTIAPTTLKLQMGGRVFGKIVARAASTSLSLHTSTCFSTVASSRDLLKVTASNKSLGKESSFTLEVRAMHPGRCAITFLSDRNDGTVDVTIIEDEP